LIFSLLSIDTYTIDNNNTNIENGNIK